MLRLRGAAILECVSAAMAVSKQVDQLRAARTRFGGRWRTLKLDLLERIAESQIDHPRHLAAYRDTLLFLEAYPDDVSVRRAAERNRRRVEALALRHASGRRFADPLRNTGIPGSVVEAEFSLDLSAWLLERYPGDVEIAWETESAGEALDEFLALCVRPVERDGLLEDCVSTREWFGLAKGGNRSADLAWLLDRIRQIAAPSEVGVRRFVVDPFQFGADNAEGIRSGAFWFYYRLGFRPLAPGLAQLAAAEWRRIGARRAYRTPAPTLRRLATSKLELCLETPSRGGSVEPALQPTEIGLAVTRAVGQRFGGDGAKAERWARRRLVRLLDQEREPPP